MKQFWSEETVNSKTRCWAQGMDGWRPLHTVPQLKWCLMATGQAALNETDLATLVLNMLIKMCEYYPSRLVSEIRLTDSASNLLIMLLTVLALCFAVVHSRFRWYNLLTMADHHLLCS